MKLTIHSDKKTGEMSIEYYKMVQKASFRFHVLKSIIAAGPDVTIIVDTNQRVTHKSFEEIEDYIRQANIQASGMSVDKDKTIFFGIPMDLTPGNKRKQTEKLFAYNITPEQFTQDFFDTCLANYDIALGIGKKKSVDEICDQLRLSVEDTLFNESFFEHCVYDSILTCLIRSSFNIETHVNAAAED